MEEIIFDLVAYFTYILAGSLKLALNFPHVVICIIRCGRTKRQWTLLLLCSWGWPWPCFHGRRTFWKLETIIPKEDKRACIKYNMYIVPLHQCLFSLISFLLPFNDFEVTMFNHLLIIILQRPKFFFSPRFCWLRFCCLYLVVGIGWTELGFAKSEPSLLKKFKV